MAEMAYLHKSITVRKVPHQWLVHLVVAGGRGFRTRAQTGAEVSVFAQSIRYGLDARVAGVSGRFWAEGTLLLQLVDTVPSTVTRVQEKIVVKDVPSSEVLLSLGHFVTILRDGSNPTSPPRCFIVEWFTAEFWAAQDFKKKSTNNRIYNDN